MCSSSSARRVLSVMDPSCFSPSSLALHSALIPAFHLTAANCVRPRLQDRLHSDLENDFRKPPGSGAGVAVVKLPKSGGVVTREPAYRSKVGGENRAAGSSLLRSFFPRS